MTFEQCKNQIELLFSTFSRNLNPRTVDAWYTELRGFNEFDLAQAVRELKTSEKLPTLGEVIKHTSAAGRRAQYRTDMQAGLEEVEPPKTRYGRASLSLLKRMMAGKLTYAKVCEYQRILMARYNVQSIPLSGDLATDHETAKLWKERRWREDLGKLGGLRKISDTHFEARK